MSVYVPGVVNFRLKNSLLVRSLVNSSPTASLGVYVDD